MQIADGKMQDVTERRIRIYAMYKVKVSTSTLKAITALPRRSKRIETNCSGRALFSIAICDENEEKETKSVSNTWDVVCLQLYTLRSQK